MSNAPRYNAAGESLRADVQVSRLSVLAADSDERPGHNSVVQLAAVGLWKKYRKGRVEIPVLRGVDLEVRDGEFLAIVGQSGSGKSTLLHLLGTLDAPDAGRGLLSTAAGSTICRPHKRDSLRNRQFGMIFQFYHLLPELTDAGKRAGAADDRRRACGATCAAGGEHVERATRVAGHGRAVAIG